MEFLRFLLSSVDPLIFGVTLVGVGCVFWYMPCSRTFCSLREGHAATAEYYKSKGFVAEALKIRKMHQDSLLRLPLYGKSLIGIGLMFVAYSLLNAA